MIYKCYSAAMWVRRRLIRFLLPCRHAQPESETSSLLSPKASVGEISVPARDGNILSVCGKRFRCVEVLLQPGFTGTRASGFYDTSLQSEV